MSNTVFLLRFFGPTFCVIGVSMLLHRKFYEEVLNELASASVAFYFIALTPFCMGLAIVLCHNLWSTGPEISVSLIGWGSLVKGVIRFLVPDVSKKMIKQMAHSPALTYWIWLVIVWGGYMVLSGYDLI